MGDSLKRNRKAVAEWDFSRRKIWRVGARFLWQLNEKEKDEQGRLRGENQGTLWGFFIFLRKMRQLTQSKGSTDWEEAL